MGTRDLDPESKYDIYQGPGRKKVATLTGKELEEKGFIVHLEKRKDGELFEITRTTL